MSILVTNISIQQRGLIVPSASTTRYFLGDVHSTNHTDKHTQAMIIVLTVCISLSSAISVAYRPLRGKVSPPQNLEIPPPKKKFENSPPKNSLQIVVERYILYSYLSIHVYYTNLQNVL